jgi:hypothetical protein
MFATGYLKELFGPIVRKLPNLEDMVLFVSRYIRIPDVLKSIIE